MQMRGARHNDEILSKPIGATFSAGIVVHTQQAAPVPASTPATPAPAKPEKEMDGENE